MNRHVSKDKQQMANRYMKRGSGLLTANKMQRNTAVRFHFTPIKVGVIQKFKIKCRLGCRGRGIKIYCLGECKFTQSLWKQYGNFPEV